MIEYVFQMGLAIAEAISIVHTIERERTSHGVVTRILNNKEDVAICIYEKGMTQRINN